MPMNKSDGPIPAYRPSHWVMLNLVNPLTRFLVGRLGLDDHGGTRILQVKGRTSGVWRSTPVRVLDLEGRQYLVALQGETQWVKNLRAQATGRIRLGSHVTEFSAVELSGADKLPVLRAYLKRWWAQSKPLTTITSPDAPDQEIMDAAPTHPVFVLK